MKRNSDIISYMEHIPYKTYAVIINSGPEAFTIYYEDYGNAAECALAYRQDGFSVEVTEL